MSPLIFCDVTLVQTYLIWDMFKTTRDFTLLYKYTVSWSQIFNTVCIKHTCKSKASHAVDASTLLGANDNMIALSYLSDRLSDTMYYK